MNINMMAIKTVTDCITMAKGMRLEASKVTTEKEYDNLYSQSMLLLDKINDALETGGYAYESYHKLHESKYIVGDAIRIAERNVLKHMQ